MDNMVSYLHSQALHVNVIIIAFKMQNVSGGVNQDCLAAMPEDEGWKCGFANVCDHEPYQ